MNNKSGRKSILKEEEVRNLIYLYKTERAGMPAGKIKAAAILEFTKRLHSEAKMGKPPALDFWYKPGRLGTKVLDEENKVFASTLSIPGGTVSVPKVIDLVEKKYKSKEELIINLIPLENLALKLVDKVNSLSDKLCDSEEARKKLIEEKVMLKEKILDSEEVIF